MRGINEYRAEVREQLPKEAFLRIDRKNALFVSDAPRFSEKKIQMRGYNVEYSGKIIRITPEYSDISVSIRGIMNSILKASHDRNRLIRQNLAVCLRLKDEQGSSFLNDLLKEEQNENSMAGPCVF